MRHARAIGPSKPTKKTCSGHHAVYAGAPATGYNGYMEVVPNLPRATHPERSRSKRDIQRPFLPTYVDREDIAYHFRVSFGTVDNWIKAGLLPEPVVFGGIERRRWSDIEEAVERLNMLAGANDAGAPSEEDDPFLKALDRGAAANE